MVWIATTLLHRERPDTTDFSLKEIEARLVLEGLTDDTRRGVYPHLSVHSVANRPPNTGRYRMLFETGPSRRRLFRPGDPYHPKREGEDRAGPWRDSQQLPSVASGRDPDAGDLPSLHTLTRIVKEHADERQVIGFGVV